MSECADDFAADDDRDHGTAGRRLCDALAEGREIGDAVDEWLRTWVAAIEPVAALPPRYARAALGDFEDGIVKIVREALCSVPDPTKVLADEIRAKAARTKAEGGRFSPYDLPALTRSSMSQIIAGWPGIALFGKVGVGKTHLGFALSQELRRLGYTTRFVSAVDLAAKLRGSFEHGAEPADRIVKRCVGATLLVIDDLDKVRLTPFVAQEFFRIIDERYQAQAPLLVTTNAAPSELHAKFAADSFGSYSAAIVDRLADLTWIRLAGSSRRGRSAA